MKEGDFIETYLTLDNEGDYVAKTNPAPSWAPIIIVVYMKQGLLIATAFLIQMKMSY
jgi:hypothetical protein